MHKNLTAYNDIEKMSNYKDRKVLNDYRAHLLRKTEKQKKFIGKIFNKKEIKILEACSGNSRLLYSLDLAGLLKQGTGIEISKSRVRFANIWKTDLGVTNIENICHNIIDYRPKKDFYDLSVCITNAFMYFGTIRNTYPQKVLDKLYSALTMGGRILLETRTYKHAVEMCRKNRNEFKTWVEFPKEDPYRYCLTHYYYHAEINSLDLNEIFIRNDGFIYDKKKESVKVYSKYEIKKLLLGSGFRNIHICSDWDSSSSNGFSDKIIAVGEKAKRRK